MLEHIDHDHSHTGRGRFHQIRILGMYLFTNPAVFFNIVQRSGGEGQTHVKKISCRPKIAVEFA